MGLGGWYTCIKLLVLMFNLFFWILGLALVVCGIWLVVEPEISKYIQIADQNALLHASAYTMIAVGAVLFIIGILGCFGAIKESRLLLLAFFVSLLIVWASCIGIGIWMIIQQETLKENVVTWLEDAVKHYRVRNSSKEVMDYLQTQLHCCGSGIGITDYYVHNITDPPDSCMLHRWTEACSIAMFNFVKQYLTYVAITAIGVGLIMIMEIGYAMCLCCAIRHEAELGYN